MNSSAGQSILESDGMSISNSSSFAGTGLVQQDSDPKDSSRSTQEWLNFFEKEINKAVAMTHSMSSPSD